MNLIWLERHQHPRPPHHELRQLQVLDSRDQRIGQVANLYVDDDMDLQFMDVVKSGGLLGLGKKHHLVPVEAIGEEAAGSVSLNVDEQTVESAPTLADPHAGPDEELQRAAREHYGYG
jgi:PRC-barrel domain protein